MSTPYTIRPFDEAEIQRAPAERQKRMRQFNKRLSSVRIISEHAYGRLKGRFRGLRGLGPHYNIRDCYRAIEALLILHNICIDLGDRPELIPWFNPKDDDEDEDEEEELDPDEAPLPPLGEANIPLHETDQWLKEQGYAKRLALLDYLFPA